MNKEELIAYVYSYLSYLFRGKPFPIDRIILFGSVARGDFDEESDIDIFIDSEKANETVLKKIADRALNKFYEVEGEKWRLRGVQNKISLKIGVLQQWKLRESVEKEGIVLYTVSVSPMLKKMYLFTFEPITPLKKRIKVIRKLFGRKEKGYNEEGLVSKQNGSILNAKTFIIPINALKEVTFILAHEKVNYKFEEIWK